MILISYEKILKTKNAFSLSNVISSFAENNQKGKKIEKCINYIDKTSFTDQKRIWRLKIDFLYQIVYK
jgi:hypothetical protein